MKISKFFLSIWALIFLCQGCAANTSRVVAQDRAKSLVDLKNGICRQDNGLMWQVEKTKIFTSGQEALTYVKNLEFGGYKDWRLPSKEELYDLCYIFELRRSGDCPIKLHGSYWQSNGDTHAGEWEAYRLCGGPEFRYLKSKTGRVLAVRP